MPNYELIEKYLYLREYKIRQSKKNFWQFCKTLHKYKDTWNHLKILCDTLQSFFENNLLDKNGNVYRKLMINMPPRHFKTRTLILFSCWLLGRDKTNTIISTSYSDDLATEFSRYTRDEIMKTKNQLDDIVYSDIFPDIKIKEGDASFRKWSLEGEHFTYLGAGFGATITGKGCKVGIIDDQLKSYEEANNESQLDKKWEWYTGTFKSRFEEGVKEIIVMTRWTNKDICGRILADPIESKQWYRLKMEAYNKETDQMLCDEMLSKDSYLEKQRLMPDDVFMANFHQEPIEKQGLLYQKFLEYDKLPEKDGQHLQDKRICYIDTADEGGDYLVAPCGVQYQKNFYLLDVICSNEPQEVTEIKVCEMLIKNEIKDVLVESNAGGRGFARNIERILKEKYKRFDIIVRWFHQSKNKLSRILTQSTNVENRVFYPIGWNFKFPEYHRMIKGFMRNKSNKHDDCPDAITGIIEMMEVNEVRIRFI